MFASRLVETRKARNITQTQLAYRLTEVGVPLRSRALRAIERGERGLSLDEALAITLELQAVPAYMVTPPESVYVKLTDDFYIDGAGIREWLRSGLPWPSRSPQEPPTSDARDDVLRDEFQRNVARLALALVDAVRASSGVREAAEAVRHEVLRYEKERPAPRAAQA